MQQFRVNQIFVGTLAAFALLSIVLIAAATIPFSGWFTSEKFQLPVWKFWLIIVLLYCVRGTVANYICGIFFTALFTQQAGLKLLSSFSGSLFISIAFYFLYLACFFGIWLSPYIRNEQRWTYEEVWEMGLNSLNPTMGWIYINFPPILVCIVLNTSSPIATRILGGLIWTAIACGFWRLMIITSR